MEIKKSKEADLEGKRATRFLLGLALVLSVFFVAFEYSSAPPSPDIDDNLLKDMLREEEDLIPLVTRKDLTVPMAAQQPKTPDEITVTDEASETVLPEEAGSDARDEEVPPAEVPEDSPEEEPSEEMTPPVANADSDPDHLRVVEELPEFPGGATEFLRWLTENLKYPKTAQRDKVQGRVVARFIVNADGSVSDISIVTPLHPLCDKEAMRVLSMMPQWKAGTQDGKPCRTMVAIPIVFKL